MGGRQAQVSKSGSPCLPLLPPAMKLPARLCEHLLPT